MSTAMEDEIKRWTAKRKSALVMDILQGKTTVAEASRAYDLPPSEIETWIDEAKRGMENALRANPLDIREQYEKQIKQLQEAYGKAMLELRARKNCSPAGRGREVIETIRQGLKEEGIVVSISQLCRWFEVPRRTFYYQPVKSPPKVQPRFAEPIKAMIEDNPSFGYRTVATCWGSTRTRCSGCSRCAAGRSGSARSGFGRGSRLGAPKPRVRRLPMR